MEVKRAPDGVAAAPMAAEIGDQMYGVTQRQHQFERHLAHQLAVDATGLAAMQHLLQAGEATPTELARELGVSTAAMTLVLDRLADAGHVTRHPHPTDRRKVVINPVAATARAAQALVDPLTTGVETLIASLDPDEQETVSTFLAGMLRVYDEVLDSNP